MEPVMPPSSPSDPPSWPDFPSENPLPPPERSWTQLGIGLLLLVLTGLVVIVLLLRYGSESVFRPPLPGEPDGPLGAERVPGQPIDYADQELKTMDYGAVNGIYAQALARAENDRLRFTNLLRLPRLPDRPGQRPG